ncbi:MAG: tRNA uridine(34) 5-carboxymethylaminomethyl modification radical SAM/GNAT enzyme Elp3, partial [Nanohaloarchaea archaeon QH_8_44_6]
MSKLKQLSRKIIEEIEAGEIEEKQEVEKRKKELCSELGFSGMPKNSDLLKFAEDDEEKAQNVLKTKPMRTISGIANVAIMARPAPCGGGCIYCPKG